MAEKKTPIETLERLMAEATPRPWHVMDKPAPSRDDHGWRAMAMLGQTVMIAAPYHIAFERWDSAANAEFLCFVANHSAALLRLWKAAEAFKAAFEDCNDSTSDVDILVRCEIVGQCKAELFAAIRELEES